MVGQATFLLSPLAEAIGHHIRAGAALHAEDSVLQKHTDWRVCMI